MPRVAEWGPATSLPRSWWYTRFRKLSPWDWAGAAAISGLLLVLYAWRAAIGAWSASNLALGIVAAIMQGLAFLSLRSVGRAEKALEAQIAGHPPGKFLGVRIEILRDDTPIGGDIGMVIFGAGMLIYAGARTGFQLRRDDVVEPSEGWGAGFRLAADPRVRVRFTRVRRKGYGSIDEALLVWLLNPSDPKGETVLPPLALMPGYRPPSRLHLLWRRLGSG